MAVKGQKMAEISIAIISMVLLGFGTHGFDIMSKFRNALLGVNVLLKDDSKCHEGLIGASPGMTNAVPNSAITASSFQFDYEPHWGRLLSSKWWMPSVHDKFQYLKIDLGSLALVRKSAVQGSGNSTTAGARVISYFLHHSKDDAIWYPVLKNENPRMFVGNLNNSEVISNSSFAPFLTRHVKFCPHSWVKQIALRVELYGCKAQGLDVPVGMEVKSVPDNYISATSTESSTYQPSNARLHLDIGGGGWCAASNSVQQPQYLQVHFPGSWALTAVATQGITSDSSCVTQYYLSTTVDYMTWIYVHDFTGKKVFRGCNKDAPLDVVLNHLPTASSHDTTGVRLHVHTWYRRGCLRVEFYGYNPSAGYILSQEDRNLCGIFGLVIGSSASPHIRTCWCGSGFEGGDDFFCEDINECSIGENVCGPDRLCKNTLGSYSCECQQGTTANGNKCKDIDECAKPRDVCPYLTECINTVGSYICDCKEPGFKADGKQCLDIDECKIGSHKCGKNSTCVNAFGSYTCFCEVGFTGWYSLDGKQCLDIDECQVKPKQCGSKGKCVNTAGSYFCLCKNGYAAKGSKCEDVDECASNPKACEQDSLCVNLPGSYVCQCKLGYHLTDSACHDLNECQQNFAECHHWADCYNTDGSYLCVCKKGFYGDGFYCSRNEQCSKEDKECNAALKRQEKRTGVKTAALKMSSGQDELKQRRLLFQALFVIVAIKLFLH